MTYWFSTVRPISLQEEMVRQGQDVSPDNFHCSNCRNHLGGCKCAQGVFIAFEGSNMASCSYWVLGRKCPHCGRSL